MEKTKLSPTILVVFGITGDLSHRYLLPALAQINSTSDLPDEFEVLGVSRRSIKINELLHKHEKSLKPFAQIVQMDLDNPNDYQMLKRKIRETGKNMSNSPQVIFYFAVPPTAVLPIVTRLGQAGLNKANAKLLLEKPFGFNLKSATDLVAETDRYFPEEQVYRIDHYLAKEVAQNIVVFLGSNAIFRELWNAQHIESIEIVASEQIGIEGREDFYEQTGALRDFLQSHLLQLAALTLMEPCSDPFNMRQVSKHRLSALKNIKSLSKSEIHGVVAGQYDGYNKIVSKKYSQTETFVGLTIHSKHPRWRGVPIRLITGKKLNEKLTEIRISFKKQHIAQTNLLVLRIQPREGIELDLWVKQPGYERRLQRVGHRFDYAHHFGRLPDAYEQVLIDVIRGSFGLFASGEEVLNSWRIVEPLQKHWSQQRKKIKHYKPGSTIEQVMKLRN